VAIDLEGSECGAVVADRLHVDHGVVMSGGFEAHGRIWMPDASIGGDLNFGGAHLHGRPGEAALLLDGARISGRLYLRRQGDQSFVANSGVTAQSARVEGSVLCTAALFERELNLRRLSVHGSVNLWRATVRHNLRLDGARISGDLRLKNATLDGPRVSLRRAEVQGALTWQQVERTLRGPLTVDLAQARAGYLEDDPENWHGAELELEGLSFGGMSVVGRGGKIDPPLLGVRHWGEKGGLLAWPRRRLEKARKLPGVAFLVKEDQSWVGKRRRWLASQPSRRWSPDPYDQVRAALRKAGHDAASRSIAVERERRRRMHARLGLGRPVNWLFGAFLGYGYRPLYAFVWSAAVIFGGWLVFRGSDASCSGDPKAPMCDFKIPKEDAPDFDSLGYSADAFLPFDLKQVSSWTPLDKADSYVLWGEIALGWLFTALLLGAVTGLLRKD
jgi:hypothetical protein